MSWDLKRVRDTLNLQQETLAERDAYIRAAEFSRDLRDIVRSREDLLDRMALLQEIHDEMVKCEGLTDMNDYIAQKALVYTLIDKFKASQTNKK